MSGILHAWNLSGFICPECPGFVRDLSRIFLCPEFVWTNSGHKKILDISFDQNSGQIPDTPDIFRTFLVTFSGHFFFIGHDDDLASKDYTSLQGFIQDLQDMKK